jgi:hypothetical protein
MRLRIASVASMAFLVAGTALAQPAGRACARVEVSSGFAATRGSGSPVFPGAGPTVGSVPRFSATKILDLTFTVLFPPKADGEHLVELRVFTPDSQLYRSLAMPVVGRGRVPGTRVVNGYARPLPQQMLARVPRGRGFFTAASTTFPVAGTDILSSGLYGRWRVEAYVDGAEQRCAPAAWFTLRP